MKLHAVLLAVAAATSVVGCNSDEVPSSATYQDCFDDQPDADPPVDKIVECCLNVIIDGERYACGTSTAECINYITNNLNQTAAGVPEVQMACEMYADMRPDTPAVN